MTAQETMNTADFKKCQDFHGHICPGLSMGFRAAKAGMAWLKENRSEDEEVVAIVETDACCADAIQVLTGCTFGKGNFIYKDHGKMALTLMSRTTGEGVRLVNKGGLPEPGEEHRGLIQKMMDQGLTPEENQRFQALHLERSCEILEAPLDQLFQIQAVHLPLPGKARMEPSEPCAQCKEPTMRTKLDEEGRCRGCRDALSLE